jgi:hypothetical protein
VFTQEDKVENVVSFLLFLVTDQIIKGASSARGLVSCSVLMSRKDIMLIFFENGDRGCHENLDHYFWY